MTTDPGTLELLRAGMMEMATEEGRLFGVDVASVFEMETYGSAGSQGGICDVHPSFRRQPLPGEIDHGLGSGDAAGEPYGFLDDGRPDPELEKALRAAVRRYVRSLLRNDEITRHGNVSAPWAMTVHPVIDALLRHNGVDVAAIMAKPFPCWTHVRQAVEKCRTLGLMNMDVCAGRLLFSDLRERRDGIGLRIGTRWAHPTRTILHLMDVHLPDTVLSAAAGMALCDIVGHDAFVGLETKIVEAENDMHDGRRCVRLGLSYDHLALAPAPSNAALSWMHGALFDA